MQKNVNATLKLVWIGMYAALVFSLQVVLAPLPNIEVVTFLLSIAGLIYTWYIAYLISLTFVMLEGIYYGFGDWFVFYLFIWNLLITIIILLKPLIKKYWFIFVIVNSLFGFMFGTLDAAFKFIFYSKEVMYAYWIKGVPFDLIHGISNTMVALFLYKKIYTFLRKDFERYLI